MKRIARKCKYCKKKGTASKETVKWYKQKGVKKIIFYCVNCIKKMPKSASINNKGYVILS